jgi:hypothetical protein
LTLVFSGFHFENKKKGENRGKNHKIVAVADDYLPTPFFF